MPTSSRWKSGASRKKFSSAPATNPIPAAAPPPAEAMAATIPPTSTEKIARRQRFVCGGNGPPGPSGTNGQNARRPTTTSAAGSIVSMNVIARKMPIAPIGPSPAVPLTSASTSTSSAAITVRPENRIAGPAVLRRELHRLVLGVVPAQLLAVARDEQQRVVGAGAEHQHRQDAAGLAVDRHARPRPAGSRSRARDVSANSTVKNGIVQKIGDR